MILYLTTDNDNKFQIFPKLKGESFKIDNFRDTLTNKSYLRYAIAIVLFTEKSDLGSGVFKDFILFQKYSK